MFVSESPCLSLAIARLKAAEPKHYAIWVLQAPFPGGYVHHDCMWSDELTQTWQAWQGLFSLRGLPDVPRISPAHLPQPIPSLTPMMAVPSSSTQGTSYSSRLMQHLGISLWRWLFDGPIQSSLDQSQGIAIGQGNPLRLRLEIRDPDLIELPWEIMQPQPGKQAVSLSQQILFSRTTSDVDPLPLLRPEQTIKILLVCLRISFRFTRTTRAKTATRGRGAIKNFGAIWRGRCKRWIYHARPLRGDDPLTAHCGSSD
jgi:hypothetical protein